MHSPSLLINIFAKSWKQTILILLLSLIVFFAIFLRLTPLTILTPTPDEKVYTEQARQILQTGPSAIQVQINQYNTYSQNWFYPAPSRFGYTAALAGFMKITSLTDINAGRLFSKIFSILNFLLIIYAGLRFFNLPITVLSATLYFALTPDLIISQRAWQDNYFAFFSILSCIFMLEYHYRPRIFFLIISFSLASFTVLIKESGLCLLGLNFVWGLSNTFKRANLFQKNLYLMTITAPGLLLVFYCFSWASGSLIDFIQVWENLHSGTVSNKYLIEMQSGNPMNLIYSLFKLSPVVSLLLILSTISLIFSLTKSKFSITRSESKYQHIQIYIIYLTTGFILAMLLAENSLNLRYLSILYGFLCLIAGAISYEILLLLNQSKAIENRLMLVFILITLIIFAAARDFFFFYQIASVPDLSIGLINSILSVF